MGLVAPSARSSRWTPVTEVILLVGLAVGVDYSLFYMRRERDERRAGRSAEAALQAAAATSGRAVLISGFTVMIAMAGMFLSGDKTFIVLRDRLHDGRRRRDDRLAHRAAGVLSQARRPHRAAPASRSSARRRPRARRAALWGAILRPVLRHPLISTSPPPRVLVALALPALCMHTAESGMDAMPARAHLETFHVSTTRSPAAPPRPSSRPPDDAAGPRRDRRAARAARPTGEIARADRRRRSARRHRVYQVVHLPLAGEGTDAVRSALATLRNELIPATIGTLPGAEYGVTGATAASRTSPTR